MKYYTIRKWIRLLEPDVRAKLLVNMREYHGEAVDITLDRSVSNLAKAINDAFIWSSSPEKYTFWCAQYHKAEKDNRTPDNVCLDIDCTIPEETP
jgi:hypothetical protein